MTAEEVRSWLEEQAEPDYQKFSAALIPGCGKMLGVRLPILRQKAKEIVRGDWREFLTALTVEKKDGEEEYFEERQLQAMVIGGLQPRTEEELEEMLSLAAAFIPKIHDWSVNDAFCSSFKAAKKWRERVWEFLLSYRDSQEEYEQRMVAVMAMDYYLTDDYIDRVLELLDGLRHEGYYQKMGVAWALATAYAKYPEKTLQLLKDNHLDDFTYNKAIQKMRESFRVSQEDKDMLQAMKRKTPRKNSSADRN